MKERLVIYNEEDTDGRARGDSRAVFVKFQQGGRLSARPKGPTLEARRAGRGSWGGGSEPQEGSEPPPHQLGVWGSAVSSPENFEFNAFWALS